VSARACHGAVPGGETGKSEDLMDDNLAARAEILAKIRNFLADILNNDSLMLTESTIADDIADWDSINHVKLLIALESELKIRFTVDEVGELKNVGQLVDLVQKKAGR
jgi:acyl carrier protein